MKIFGINLGKNNAPKASAGTKPEITAEMAEFMATMNKIKAELKKRLNIEKDNFKKMSESTDNYQGLEHFKKHLKNPLDDLKIARDTILDATKRHKTLKAIAKNLGIPEEEVTRVQVTL